MADRRYSDEDVRRILALAAEAEAAAANEPERTWTLADLEQIGAEAGLAPQAVAAAALALERRAVDVEPERGSYFGLPVAVSRTVPLQRHLSDEDWERLVAQLRETFAATGRTRVSCARREWRVGNLRVTHEPAGAGALLELRTRKGDARAFLRFGALLVVVALVARLLATMGGAAGAQRLTIAWMTGIAGMLLMIVGVLRLPAWARRRARQFEALAAYARRIAAT